MKSLINQTIRTVFLAIALTSPLALVNLPAAHSENVGTSCEDCPSYRGAFSIENNTGKTIQYQVRWGSNHAWKSITLRSGMKETHSYPLGENKNAKVPTPYVRFDGIGGDGSRVTLTEYRMSFYAVGYAGYTDVAHQNRMQPKRYYFEYASDRRHLNLFHE
jgi:hypothetical protein